MWVERLLEARDESVCAKVTVHTLRSVIKKWKPGTSSCDGVTAEVWTALPGVALKSLAEDFTRILRELDIPEEWTEVSACLIPKTPAPKELKSYLPVLASVRKLCGYTWMELLPKLEFRTFQTAFI